MKKEILCILSFLLIVIPKSLIAQEYSLDDLYRLALERSETIKIAEEYLFISKKEKDKANAVLLPTLSAFGSYTRYSKDKIRNTIVLQPERKEEWGLRLDQSLSLSGREFTALKIAKDGIKKSRHDLDAVKEEYLLNVASSYYDVLKSEKALEIAGANVERLTKHRNAAKTRLKVGEATKTVLLRAEAELAGAQSELIRAKNSMRLTRTVLARTVGIRGNYAIKEPHFEKDFGPREQELLDILIGDCRLSTIDCLKERAFSERSDIKTASIQKQIAKHNVEYTKGSYWPDLSLEGIYFREENEPSTSFGLNERTYGVLKLNFPFFEGGLRKAEVGEAKAELRQAEHNHTDLKHSVGIEVVDSYLTLQTVSAVLTQLKAEVEYASDNYNAVTKQFKYGLADSIDIIDANTLLVTSERELANAEYDYQLAVLILKRATGILLKTVVSGHEITHNE
jgi:outer membrane protein